MITHAPPSLMTSLLLSTIRGSRRSMTPDVVVVQVAAGPTMLWTPRPCRHIPGLSTGRADYFAGELVRHDLLRSGPCRQRLVDDGGSGCPLWSGYLSLLRVTDEVGGFHLCPQTRSALRHHSLHKRRRPARIGLPGERLLVSNLRSPSSKRRDRYLPPRRASSIADRR